MKQSIQHVLHEGMLLDEQAKLSLKELCCACSSSAEWIIELVEEGALEPERLNSISNNPFEEQQNLWCFNGYNLQRAQTARRLQRDLNINIAGVALALELLEQINSLQEQLQQHSR